MAEEVITVNVPFYGYECTMPWVQWQGRTVRDFMSDALDRAARTIRYSIVLTRPAFGILIPGTTSAITLDSLVYQEMTPGSFVMILSQSESRMYLAGQGVALAPEEREAISSAGMSISSPPTMTTGGLLARLAIAGLAARYLHRRDEPDEDNEDEEYVAPPRISVERTLDLINTMMGGGAANPAAITGGIKKVLNEETFHRVCPVLSSEEITGRTTTSEQEVGTEENDIIGGSQDAGLGACSVCLGLLVNRIRQPPVEIRKMPNCTHIFHSTCLSEWLTKNSITCPVCREPAVTERGDYGYLGYGTEVGAYTPAITVTPEETRTIPQGQSVWEPAEFPPLGSRRSH